MVDENGVEFFEGEYQKFIQESLIESRFIADELSHMRKRGYIKPMLKGVGKFLVSGALFSLAMSPIFGVGTLPLILKVSSGLAMAASAVTGYEGIVGAGKVESELLEKFDSVASVLPDGTLLNNQLKVHDNGKIVKINAKQIKLCTNKQGMKDIAILTMKRKFNKLEMGFNPEDGVTYLVPNLDKLDDLIIKNKYSKKTYIVNNKNKVKEIDKIENILN